MIFDLHTHTYFSDGVFSPEKIIEKAIENGLNGVAITDHDTILGIEPAIKYSKKRNDIIVIPGIEFGCIYNQEEVHILGYFIDYNSKDIIRATRVLRQNRIARAMKMIKKINSLGMKLSIEDVKKNSRNDFIGRPHFARALVEKEYVNSVEEAFDKWLNRDMPAYVEKRALTVKETIELIHKANGFAILAHPGMLKNKDIINYCIQNNIDGLEAIHPKHKEEDVKMFLRIGKYNQLIVTGGSDFHGAKPNSDSLLGKYYVNINDIPKMKGRL